MLNPKIFVLLAVSAIAVADQISDGAQNVFQRELHAKQKRCAQVKQKQKAKCQRKTDDLKSELKDCQSSSSSSSSPGATTPRTTAGASTLLEPLRACTGPNTATVRIAGRLASWTGRSGAPGTLTQGRVPPLTSEDEPLVKRRPSGISASPGFSVPEQSLAG